jgi:trimethylamine--corrinoid protein Co-methyltransferase
MEQARRRRGGGGSARRTQGRAPERAPGDGRISGYPGGHFKPLSQFDVERIHRGVLRVLERVGMGVIGNLPPGAKLLLNRGAWLNEHDRICFPGSLIEDTLAAACKRWTLHGLDPERSLEIAVEGVHYGTAGGAVQIADFETGRYRDPTLLDLYDVVRLIDTLPNIRWCYRPLIARDMTTVAELDINTAYALAAGTTKPWGITIGAPDNVTAVVALFDLVLGGEGRFAATPTCHMVQGAGVPPLRFAEERCLIKEAAIRHGLPLMIASAPQAGATAPAALAGTIVQVVAEILAGLAYANAVAPGHPVAFAPWPFVSDLRTGAMTGGSGEQALLMAGVAQMGSFYGLPCSVAAGMADSKIPDAQSGFEKGYTTALAGLAGANMIHESAGMHASLIGCAFESFVIDDDMLGNVMRTVRGIEVSDRTLSLEAIEDVNLDGAGHYLGHDQTLALMRSEYHYPPLSDRASPADWEQAGARDIAQRAKETVRRTLATHFPDHLDAKVDAEIRRRFDIRLPRAAMQPDGRWR